MENHLLPAILLFLSISTFPASNPLQFRFSVTNEFTSEKPILLRVTYGGSVGALHTIAESRVPHGESLSWTMSINNNREIACNCYVTEFKKPGGVGTYYGFFQVFTSQILQNAFEGFVNEEGAFVNTENNGYQPLHVWLKLQFYVYNLYTKQVKLSAISGAATVVKLEKVEPNSYMHWTRIVHEKSNLFRRFTYECRVHIAGEWGSEKKIIQVFDSSSLNVEFLKKHGTVNYEYGVKEEGIGYYNPETSKYTHLRNWPSST